MSLDPTLAMQIVRLTRDMVMKKEGGLGSRFALYHEYARRVARYILEGKASRISRLKNYYKALGLREEILDELAEQIKDVMASAPSEEEEIV